MNNLEQFTLKYLYEYWDIIYPKYLQDHKGKDISHPNFTLEFKGQGSNIIP